MAYWLVKEEPEKDNFAKLLKDGETAWEGVHSCQARNPLSGMAVGDALVNGGTGKERSAVGTAMIHRETEIKHVSGLGKKT